MSILQSANRRYSAKAFDATKKLTDEQIDTLKEVLCLSPSSLNLQAWHFVLCHSDAAKARLAQSCHGAFEYNAKKVKDASLVVLFCAKTDATKTQVNQVIEQEFSDGRFPSEQAKDDREALMTNYIDNLNTLPARDMQAWLDKQTYIALGNILLAAADMAIDSVPVEGFDKSLADELFGLSEKGYHSTVLACFGHHSDADFNAKLPKSRLPEATLLTEL